MIVIPLSIVIISLVISFKSIRKAVWFNISLILSIPLGNILPTINTNQILRIGSITAFEINIIFIFFIIIGRGRIRINKLFTTPIILLSICSFYILLSLHKYGINSVLADSKDYIISMILVIIMVQIAEKDSIDILAEITLKSLFCASIIIFIGYIFTRGTIFPTSARYGFSIQALYIFTIPYTLYEYSIKKRIEVWKVLALILQLYLMIISQNRTNLILILTSILLLSIYYIFISRNITKVEKNKFRIVGSIFVISLLCFSGYIYLNRDIKSGYLGRINEMIFNNFETDSTEVRDMNKDYYLKEIKNNIWGYGLGKYMPALSIYTTEFDETTLKNYGFDNVFLTMSYKIGVFPVLIYVAFFIRRIYDIFINRKRNKDSILFIVIILALYFTGAIMTQQLLRNISMYTFIIALLVCLNKRNRYDKKTN